jgi:hypothetical protein
MFHDDERAVRNVVGFVLAFSIILVSVGLVSTFGYQQLEDVTRNERLENAEQGMELVATNVEELRDGQAAVRANEIDLASGALSVVDGPTVTVDVGGTNFDRTLALGGLRYRLGSTDVTYENGGLFRADGNGNARMLSRPSLTCTDQRAVVSLVSVDAESTTQVSGTSVSVKSTVESRRLLFPMNRTGPDSATDADEVAVTVSSPRSDAWGQHFTGSGNWTAHPSLADTYVCDDIETAYVRETAVSIGFGG